MKNIRSFFAVSIAIIGLFIVSVNAQSFVSKNNRSIDEQVARKLKGLFNYGVFDHIEWQVEGSTLVLEGKVHSIGTKSEAAAEMKRIPGITRVVNNIDQLPGSTFDDRIRRAALIRFTQSGPAQYFSEISPDVRIIVDGGRMTLEGFVARQSDRDMLNVLANGISGVFEVTNNLVVGKRAF